MLLRSGRSFARGLLLIAVAAGVIYGGDAGAAERSIKAAVTVREEYDDNIFLTRDNRVSDYITRATPSIALSYKMPLWELALEDTFHWWHYARRDASYFSNYMDMSSKLTVVRNLVYFDVTDNYSNVVLEPRGPSTDANLNVNRSDTNVLNASPYIKYKLDARDTLRAGYVYTNIWYRQSGVSRQQHKAFMDIGHKFTPALEIMAGGEYLDDRPEKAEPSDTQTSAFSSVVYDITPRTRFDGTVGYRWIRFSNAVEEDRLTYNAGLAYAFSEAGNIGFRAVSDFSASPLDGIVENVRQEVNFLYAVAPGSSIRAGAYHREDNYVQIVRTDEAYGLTAGFDYTPVPRIVWHVSGYCERDKYTPDTRRRTTYSVSTGMDYKITPKIILGLTYRYHNSSGDIETDRYIDNLAGIQLRAEL